MLFVAAGVPGLGAGQSVPIAGAWTGAIVLPQVTLDIRLVLSEGAEGLSGTIDIPAQGATGLPLRAVTRTGTGVRFELATGGPVAVFDGQLAGTALSGTFTQGPARGTFRLTPASPSSAVASEPRPYREEELTVAVGDAQLAGTVAVPDGTGPFPAAVLLSGSGARPRDGDVFGFKIQGAMADALARQGVLTYRFDDRGTGRTKGPFAQMTTELHAVDAVAMVEALAARGDVDRRRLGLLGHSEGATVAAIAATRSDAVRFVVMLAGPGVRGDLVLRDQTVGAARAIGTAPEDVARIVAAHEALLAAVRDGAPVETLSSRVRDLVTAQIDGVPPALRPSAGDRAAAIEQGVKLGMAQTSTPWIRFAIGFDPAPTLRDVRVPAFAVFGGLDVQVTPALNHAPMEAALAGNARATIRVYPDANHLFQRAKTGAVAEYPLLEKAFVPGLMTDIGSWILTAN